MCVYGPEMRDVRTGCLARIEICVLNAPLYTLHSSQAAAHSQSHSQPAFKITVHKNIGIA